MKDFENVEKIFVISQDYGGHWFETPEGMCYDGDLENEYIVRYDDYKDLLDAYKELLWMREELEK